MPDSNISYDLYRLFGAGDAERYAAINSALERGHDLLSLIGEQERTNVIVGAQALAASMTSLSGWTLPTLVYVGRPITIILDVGFCSNNTAQTASIFRIMESNTDTELKRGFAVHPYVNAGSGAHIEVTVPIAERFELEIGDELDIYVQGMKSGGTASVSSEWENALLGSVPVTLRAVQE